MKLPKAVKLPSGSWNVKIMVNGERISITAPTEKQAIAEAAAVKAGKKHEKSPGKVTLSAAIDAYIESKAPVLSPATVRGYRTAQKHRFPSLMQRDVYGITKADVQRAVNLEKCSAKTIANAYGLIRPVLKEHGVDVFGVRLPQIVKPVKQYLQPEDIGKLIQAVEGDSCEIPILLAVWLGMRRSEIIGLCWDCVDLDRGVLHIRRTVVPDEHNHWVLKETAKNTSSQRTVDCPEYILDKLRGIPEPHKGQLFRVHPDTVRKHVHRACAAAGITDTTVHGLRHTNAAVMKTLGIDDRHAIERGGWSCESTYRKTYSYVFDSAAQQADTAINGFFSEKLPTKLPTKKNEH